MAVVTIAVLSAVNISVDTLQRQRFRAITGCDAMPDWNALLRCCVQAGITTKTNTVLLAENREEWAEIAALAQDLPICVRFIEQMPLGQGIAAGNCSESLPLQRIHADVHCVQTSLHQL